MLALQAISPAVCLPCEYFSTDTALLVMDTDPSQLRKVSLTTLCMSMTYASTTRTSISSTPTMDLGVCASLLGMLRDSCTATMAPMSKMLRLLSRTCREI
jgi:hypothetical protein